MKMNYLLSFTISEPCLAGQYLDQQTGCQDCPTDQWSAGGTTSSCSNCPIGQSVEAGLGTSEEECVWSK